MENIPFASATTLAKLIRDGDLTSVAVVEAYLERIEVVNPRINALVQSTAQEALKQARAADAALDQGEIWGALHGVPFTVKDNIETEGVICSCGTLGLAQNIPAQDAKVVERIRAAGGILLGKTNLPELGMGYESDNLVYGRTNNPYDLTRVSGGSSGGEAALIAAGGSPLGLGTDGGGSARWPAHCCGIVGLKPTTGRTPKVGHVPPAGGALNSFWQMGLLARFVEDVALTLPIICGVDSRDPSTVPVPLLNPHDVELSDLRIAVFTDNGIISPDAETVSLIEQCAEMLANAGARVSRARPAMLERSHEIYYRLLSASGGLGILELLESWGTTELHPYTIQAQIAQSKHQLTTAGLEAYLYQQDVFRASLLAFMDDYDAILCPVSPQPAVPHGATYQNQKHPGSAEAFSYLMTFNLTGWPCGTVRTGTSATGLPLGVQVAAPPWREDIVLATLQQLQDDHGGWQPPPL